MKVSDVMNTEIVSVSPDETVSLAARLLSRHNIGSVPVCTGDGQVRGILTDRDIVLRCVAAGEDPETTQVREVMSRSIISVNPGDEVKRAAELMGKGQVRRLPVTDEGRLVGVVSLGDLARISVCDMEAAHALGEISMNVRQR